MPAALHAPDLRSMTSGRGDFELEFSHYKETPPHIGEKIIKQAQAAKILRVTQPRVSDLLRGRIDLFSTDSLIDMLARLGVGVRIVVKTRSKKVA